jgi:benzoate-CoA ligase family protein
MTGSSNAASILYRNVDQGRENKIAIFCGDETWTYGNLVSLTNRIGNALIGLEVERENRIALLLVDGPEFVASFYGAVAIGAVPVPLNTWLSSADYESLLNHCRAKIVIVSSGHLSLIEPIRDRCSYLRHIIVSGGGSGAPGTIDWESWLSTASPELTPTDVSPDEPAFWLYTSGSTGQPKGVIHLHRAIPYTCRQVGQQLTGLEEGDICLSAAKLFHAYGLGNGMNFPIYVGATTILWPGPALPQAMLELISRFRPTFFSATPAHFVGILALCETGDKYDMSSLRLCFSGGEALPVQTFHQWKDRFGVQIVDAIGSTEMLNLIISNVPGACMPGSSGKPVPGYKAKLVDDIGRPVPPGQIGDLWVSGESSAIGYWLDRKRTKAIMQGEWVVTGDKFCQDEQGYFWYHGRADDMLKVNGLWVSPLELESVLNRHDAVAECAVIGSPDADGLMQLKAFVVLKPGVVPAERLMVRLRNFARQHAPQRYPKKFEFVKSLPRTVTGKIKRFQLREKATTPL